MSDPIDYLESDSFHLNQRTLFRYAHPPPLARLTRPSQRGHSFV
jgi:hypothetical protein